MLPIELKSQQMLTFVNKCSFFIQFYMNGLLLESSFQTNLKIVITGNYIQPKVFFKDKKSKCYIGNVIYEKCHTLLTKNVG